MPQNIFELMVIWAGHAAPAYKYQHSRVGVDLGFKSFTRFTVYKIYFYTIPRIQFCAENRVPWHRYNSRCFPGVNQAAIGDRQFSTVIQMPAEVGEPIPHI